MTQPTPTTRQPIPTRSSLIGDRKQEAYRVASALYNQSPDWVTFFREVLGIGGVVRRLFPETGSLAEFEKTDEYNEIQLMLARLRKQSNARSDKQEPTRVITVRLPKSLHEALQAEAHTHQTSMNKLCIAKLLQVIDNELTGGNSEQITAEPQGSVPQSSILHSPVPNNPVPNNPVPNNPVPNNPVPQNAEIQHSQRPAIGEKRDGGDL